MGGVSFDGIRLRIGRCLDASTYGHFGMVHGQDLLALFIRFLPGHLDLHNTGIFLFTPHIPYTVANAVALYDLPCFTQDIIRFIIVQS